METEQQTENTEQETSNWLTHELEEVLKNTPNLERPQALKLEENKIVKMTIDFSKPFEKWVEEDSGTIKKIIPVKVNDIKFVWWLNVKNPVYSQIIQKGNDGQVEFSILQTGTQKTTKYSIVE